jgi:hypothetical protein
MRLATLLTAALIISFSTVKAQLPQLTASDKTTPIKLQKLDVGVKVIGTRASTTLTMTFHNPADRVLEGTFVLPLPDGASVVRYALDIEGKMREGVPVEKAKATEVFESVEKRRIDPGLLERTEGNVFRTRIFPLPAGGERSIIIGYEQDLQLSANGELLYHLPLQSKDTLGKFSVSVDVQERDDAPQLQSTPIQELNFLLSKGHYCAHEERESINLNKPLSIRIVKKDKEAESFVQRKNGAYYFYLQTFVPPAARDKKLPTKLAVIWDNSLSGLYRNTQKEIELLEAYLERLGAASIQLYTLSNTFQSVGTFTIKNGASKELLEKLKTVVYDGGTDYSKIRFSDASETLLFSDGLSTISDPLRLRAPHIVYTISSSAKADFNTLRSIAEENGGSLINLNSASIDGAVSSLSKQTLLFWGIKENKGVKEHYPNTPVVVQNGLSMAGMLDQPSATITLQFGYGKKVAFEQTVQLAYEEYNVEEWDLNRLFAQKKIDELDKAYEQNSTEILQLGKRHGIVTRNTSLLVLEDVMDYVRHEIEPPLELRSEYKQLLKERKDELSQNRHNTLESAVEYSKELWSWYNTSYPKKTLGKRKQTISNMVLDSVAMTVDQGRALMNAPPPPPPPRQEGLGETKIEVISQEGVKDEEVVLSNVLQGNAPGVQVQEVVVSAYSTPAKITIRGISTLPGATENNGPLLIVDGRVVTNMPPKEQIEQIETLEPKAGVALYGTKAMHGVLLVTTKGATDDEPVIKLDEKTSSASYMRVLAKTPRSQQYQTYLSLRDKNLLNPTFYYDVASFFLMHDRALGLQVLTNLAELDYQNHELHKLFGFKLKELGQMEQQLFVFRKILQWRPQEPQSYRDYGLALADAGRYQAALDTLYLALAKEYNSDIMADYEGIEETIIMELNNLMAKHRAKLDLSRIDRKLLHPMPVDIRVVMNWNMNDTDMDLWITDPSGEKCMYNNAETKMGGRLSEDFINGYGPEQFLLKKAPKGKYKIEVHYYGERGVKIAGKTTLLMEVYTNYGRSTEHRRIITLQLEGEEKEGVYVGEFVF